jgi:hypothetical protein
MIPAALLVFASRDWAERELGAFFCRQAAPEHRAACAGGWLGRRGCGR